VTRTIKRYANRKLYDTVESKYVTLNGVADLVRGGEDVRIIDNTTKEDLTAVTLAQILFEGERSERVLPLATLRGLIQSGGEFIEKTISKPVTTIREETERRVNAARAAITKREDDARDFVQNMVGATQKSLDDFQSTIDDQVQGMMKAIAQVAVAQRQLGVLTKKIEKLEARVAELEADDNGV
jgi:polyhydroxyalkanoate synthesis repressor PhaR